jgi:hypothetical protein
VDRRLVCQVLHFDDVFLVCHAVDTASLATWFLFGKLLGVATLVSFGEKRCRKNLPLCAMVTNLIIAFVLAVAIVFVWAWLGDWAGTRSRHADDAYWASHELHCPNCNVLYTPDCVSNRWVTFSESPMNGASLTCPSCGEIASFSHTDDAPRYLSLCDQPRECLSCGERFNGVPDSACPVCSATRSPLAHNTAHPQSPLRGTPSV